MPEEDATLDQLFPNLAPYLRENVPMVTNEHTGEVNPSVSMEDVDAYMRGKVNPMFRSGVGAPAPKGGWEDGAPGTQSQTPGQITNETPQPQPQTDPDAPTPDTGERATPSSPPGQSNDPSTPPSPTPAEMPQPFQTGEGDENKPPVKPNEPSSYQTTPSPTTPQDGEQYVQLGDQRVPYSRIQAYLALDQELQRDENLRNLLAQHFAGGEGRPAPTPTPSATDPFAEVLSEYGDDPAVQAILSVVRAQQESLNAEIARLNGYVQTTYQQTAEQRMRDYEKAVDEGVSNFQRQYNLTAEEIADIQAAAASLNVVNSLEPKLGAKGAVEKALETAYFMDQKWRDREVARVAQEQRSESTRKQKLAAISGSSGSVPRTTPAPTTPEGNRAAMLEEVANMMSGSWTGDN